MSKNLRENTEKYRCVFDKLEFTITTGDENREGRYKRRERHIIIALEVQKQNRRHGSPEETKRENKKKKKKRTSKADILEKLRKEAYLDASGIRVIAAGTIKKGIILTKIGDPSKVFEEEITRINGYMKQVHCVDKRIRDLRPN